MKTETYEVFQVKGETARQNTFATSARCDCRNDHGSSSGRCNNRDVVDPTRPAGGFAACEYCRENCPCGHGPLAIVSATMTDAEHTEHLIRNHDASVKHRARMEVSIIRRTIRVLTTEGFALMVDDGGEEGEETKGDERALIEAVMSVDEARLFATKGAIKGWVFFVMGNDGYDVICDYTVNLENEMADVNAYADRLSEGGPLEDGEQAPAPAAGHTPGPWIARHSDLSKTANYIVQNSAQPARGVPLIAVASDGNPQCDANARLIAAAPELLAALRAIAGIHGNLPTDDLDSDCGPHDGRARGIKLQGCIESARAAIAKAGGAL